MSFVKHNSCNKKNINNEYNPDVVSANGNLYVTLFRADAPLVAADASIGRNAGINPVLTKQGNLVEFPEIKTF